MVVAVAVVVVVVVAIVRTTQATIEPRAAVEKQATVARSMQMEAIRPHLK